MSESTPFAERERKAAQPRHAQTGRFTPAPVAGTPARRHVAGSVKRAIPQPTGPRQSRDASVAGPGRSTPAKQLKGPAGGYTGSKYA